MTSKTAKTPVGEQFPGDGEGTPENQAGEPAAPEPKELTAEERDAALRASYTAADKRLREAHEDEFNGYRQEEAKARGVEWSPKPTKEQKAAAEVQRLLAENPGIRESLGL